MEAWLDLETDLVIHFKVETEIMGCPHFKA
jgi:hypothetical protein